MIVLKHSEMLVLGDNQYNREGVQRCTPKSSKEVAKIAGVAYNAYEKIQTEIQIFVYGDRSAVVPVKSPVPELTVSQRAQMVVEKYTWFENGGDRRSRDFSASRNTKNRCSRARTKLEMAQEANVSPAAIDRAKQVSRIGRSDEVISGEKSASAVLRDFQI